MWSLQWDRPLPNYGTLPSLVRGEADPQRCAPHSQRRRAGGGDVGAVLEVHIRPGCLRGHPAAADGHSARGCVHELCVGAGDCRVHVSGSPPHRIYPGTCLQLWWRGLASPSPTRLNRITCFVGDSMMTAEQSVRGGEVPCRRGRVLFVLPRDPEHRTCDGLSFVPSPLSTSASPPMSWDWVDAVALCDWL